MDISVAMATYNGERYIDKQLVSILKQLGKNDELIISDDGSTDSTVEIIRNFQKNDSRIKLIYNEAKGIISNFENSIINCRNEIIFLSDQDDIWRDDKIAVTKECFNNSERIVMVMSDACIVDEELKIVHPSFFRVRKSKSGIIRNIYKNSYLGCTLAFRKDALNKIIPIPRNIAMHDIWIGIICSSIGKVYLCNEQLVYYRRHKNTVTKIKDNNPVTLVFKWRKNLIINLMKRILYSNK